MGILQPLEKPLDKLNKKLPALPKNTKDSIAKVAQWIVLAGAALSALIVWRRWENIDDINKLKEAFGIWGTYVNREVASTTNDLWILLIIAAVATVLFAAAFLHLKKAPTEKGWEFAVLGLFASLLYILAYLILIRFDLGEILIHLLLVLAGLYAALQTKEHFTKKEPKEPAKPKTDK